MSTYGFHDRPEYQVPKWSRALDREFLLPLITYFIMFRVYSKFIKATCWQKYQGFKRYRLENLSVCFTHSMITGLIPLFFLIFRSDIMFHHTLHYYTALVAQLPTLSIAYFLHDSVDMLQYEWSKWTLELLFHHVACIFEFAVALFSNKFVIYAYWALLMEMNSIFLHARSLMQISGAYLSHPKEYRIIQYINVGTFVCFRYTVQLWQIWWVVVNRSQFHTFYFLVAGGGGVLFLFTNTLLFSRILSADGFFGEERKKAATKREKQALEKKETNGTSKNE